jgi:hypothetical protein
MLQAKDARHTLYILPGILSAALLTHAETTKTLFLTHTAKAYFPSAFSIRSQSVLSTLIRA